MVNCKQNARLKLNLAEKTGSKYLLVKSCFQNGLEICLKSFTIYNLQFTIYNFCRIADKIIVA